MGVCTSSNGKKGELQSKKKEADVRKVLLLGAGESGKSTVYKHFLRAYGNGFSDTDRADYAPVVYSNVLLSMKTLCEETPTLQSQRAREAKSYMENKVAGNEELDEVLAKTVSALWECPEIQATYVRRNEFQLDDNAAYFFNKVHELARDGYQMPDEDIMLARVRTTGIVDHDFEISQNTFRIMDMGGQKGERIKWSKAFEQHVHAVIFVASLSEFDQKLREDEKTNRLEESVALFEEVSSCDALADSALVLVLTKSDILSQKLKTSRLQEYCPDYKGTTDEDAVEYIKAKFVGANKRGDKMTTVLMNATESTDGVHEQALGKIVDAILEHLLSSDLQWA